VERLSHWVFVRGGVALALPLAGFGIWSLCVNGAAGGAALGSSIVVWLWAVALNHLMMWPALLLLSAGVWRDIAPLPEEQWRSADAAAAAASFPPPPAAAPFAAPEQQARPPKRGLFGAGRSGGGGGGGKDDAAAALAGVTVMAPPPAPGNSVYGSVYGSGGSGGNSNPYGDNPFAADPAATSAWDAPDGRGARRAHANTNTGAW
jgi:hypothetical protein